LLSLGAMQIKSSKPRQDRKVAAVGKLLLCIKRSERAKEAFSM